MPKGGLEPPRACGHWLLKPARVRVPPLRRDCEETQNVDCCITRSQCLSCLQYRGKNFHRQKSPRAARLPAPGNVGGGTGAYGHRGEIAARSEGELERSLRARAKRRSLA